jgi:hypothetical protein
MSDFHGVFSRLSEGDNVSDAVAGITDALALVLMALVANGVVDAEKFATGFLRAGRSAGHGPWAKGFLEDCARTVRATATEIEDRDADFE